MYLDVLQFAYKPQRVTEDVMLTMVDTIASHLQQAKAYICTPPPHSHPPNPPSWQCPRLAPI